MSKLSKRIIAIGAGVLVLICLILFFIFEANRVYVAEGEVGAQAGNLYNYGLFCESEGKVYFSNSYDSGCLYSMNPDQTNIRKVYNLEAKYINAGGGYVFFRGDSVSVSSGLGSVLSKPGMYMVKGNGKKFKALTQNISQTLLVVGNNIYYEHYTKETGTTLAKYSLKKLKSEEVLNYMATPASCYNGSIYFNGMYDDHYLYTYNTATGEVNTVFKGDLWFPICDGDYVYYLDVYNNYRLCRYSVSNNTIEVLSAERLDCFNYYNGVIYYQVSSAKNPMLKRMNADGSGDTVIAEGIFNSINITSSYTYFKQFGDDYTIYCTPTYGAPAVAPFTAAQKAVTSK